MIDGLKETTRSELLQHINENFAFIDFEFTCQEENNGKLEERSKRELLAVGLLIVRLEKAKDGALEFKVTDQYEEIIKPLRNPAVSEYCTNLTGITTQQAMKAREPSVVLSAVKNVLQKYNVVRLFNWGERDKQILGNALYHLYCFGKGREGAIYIHQYIYDIEKEIVASIDPNIKKAGLGLKKVYRLSDSVMEWDGEKIGAENIDEIKVHSPLMDCALAAVVTEKYLNNDSKLAEAVRSCIKDINKQREELRRQGKWH